MGFKGGDEGSEVQPEVWLMDTAGKREGSVLRYDWDSSAESVTFSGPVRGRPTDTSGLWEAPCLRPGRPKG